METNLEKDKALAIEKDTDTTECLEDFPPLVFFSLSDKSPFTELCFLVIINIHYFAKVDISQNRTSKR